MFAASLSRETRLLILDEATNGLDPVMRRDVLKLLQDSIATGERSVLFSTHIMEDLQDIADYIFFIDRGRKVLCEAKDDLLERYLLARYGTEALPPSWCHRPGHLDFQLRLTAAEPPVVQPVGRGTP